MDDHRPERRALEPAPANASAPAAPAGQPAWHYRHVYAGGQELEDTISSALVLAAAARWWKVALPAALVLAAASTLAIWLLYEPVYRATALILIEETAPYIVQPVEEQSKRYVQTQIELMRSPLVLGPLVSKPEIARLPRIRRSDDPIRKLADTIEVSSKGGSEIYRVSCEQHDPQSAALVTNAILDEYFKLHVQSDTSRSQRVIELLEEEKRRHADEVARLRAEVRRLGQKVLGKDPFSDYPSGKVMLSHRTLTSTQNQLSTTEVDRQILEAQIKAFEELVARNRAEVSDAAVEAAIDNEPQIQQTRALIQTKHTTLQRIDAASAHGRDDPAYHRVEREIQSHEKALEAAREALRPQVKQRLQMLAILHQKQELADMQTRLERYRVMEQALRQRYEDQLSALGQTGSESLDFEFARSELAREENVFEMIARRVMAMRTELRAPQRVTLLRRATPPAEPVRRLPLQMMGLALLASFCLPFGVAVVWEFAAQRIRTADQLESQTELSVVGEITRFPLRHLRNRKRGRQVRYGGVFQESVDSLRTCLVLADEHADVSVLAVTSAVPGEGKTSVASQLAASIARSSGQLTLLIDADLRCPDIQRVFRIDNDLGLSDLLEGRCRIEEAIVADWSDHLHLLPAGRLHKSPHELLGNGSFQQLLACLRQTYRYIIIDTPPVLSASEALVVAQAADGALVCAMRDHSRRRQLRTACDRLLATGANPIGAVLSGVPPRRYASSYGSYGYRRT